MSTFRNSELPSTNSELHKLASIFHNLAKDEIEQGTAWQSHITVLGDELIMIPTNDATKPEHVSELLDVARLAVERERATSVVVGDMYDAVIEGSDAVILSIYVENRQERGFFCAVVENPYSEKAQVCVLQESSCPDDLPFVDFFGAPKRGQ